MHTKLEIQFFLVWGIHFWYLWCPLSFGLKCFVRPISTDTHFYVNFSPSMPYTKFSVDLMEI